MAPSNRQIPTKDAGANPDRVQKAYSAMEQVLGEALQRGFYGTAAVEVTVKDGTIVDVRTVRQRTH